MAKGKGAAGGGSIRKKTVLRDGKEYTYWEGRVTVGRDPGTGRQKQRSFYGKTQKEVREKIQAAAAAVDNGTYRDPVKMTVAAWLGIWQEAYLVDIKPLTLAAYQAAIRNHIIPGLGAAQPVNLQPHDIQLFYNRLGEKLSAKTVHNVHGILHKALQQAVKNGILGTNPAAACTLPKHQRPEIRPLDSEQMRQLLSALEGDPFEAPLTMALFTGLREGELLGLTWDCVDLDRGVVTICQQLQKEKKAGGKYYLAPTKNSKPRTITPAPFVVEILRRQRAHQAEQRLIAGPLWFNPDNLVWTNATGGHLVPYTVFRHLKDAAASIGRPDLRVHDLRHSYAVAAIRAGDDIKTVQDTLGHATAAFTLDVYGHVTEEMKQESADRMEKFIQMRVRVK